MSIKEKFENLPVSVQAGLIGGAGVWGLSLAGVLGGSFTSVLLISVAVGAITGVSGETIQEWWKKRQEKKAIREQELAEARAEMARLEKEKEIASDPLYVGLQWVKDNLQHLPAAEQDELSAFILNFEVAAAEVMHDDAPAAISDRTTLTGMISNNIPKMISTFVKVAPMHRNREDENGATPLELYRKGIRTYHTQLKTLMTIRHERATSKLGTQVLIAEHHLVRIGGVEGQADVSSSEEVFRENQEELERRQNL